MACKPVSCCIPPGTKVNGTVLFAQKAPDKYWRPRLVLDFSNIVHKDGKTSPLYARVIDVDNARETVRNNEILGIIQPHVTGKVSLAFAALGAINPIAGYTINGVRAVYGLSIRREILFPAGTDMQVQVVRPSMLTQKEAWQAWPTLPLTPQAAHPGRARADAHPDHERNAFGYNQPDVSWVRESKLSPLSTRRDGSRPFLPISART